MENLYPTKEGSIPQTNETSNPPPFETLNSLDFQSGNLYDFPHKGIFQPNSNTLICKTHCCCKFIGLYVMLFGSIFGIIFPIFGIAKNLIVLTIIGSLFFLITIIIGTILFCTITTEVKFTFSHPMVEITVFSVCRKKNKIIEKSEIANIIFEYIDNKKNNRNKDGAYHSLHIMFKNGIQEDYFSFSSSPPCFTKFEVDYFNNEIKRLLQN